MATTDTLAKPPACPDPPVRDRIPADAPAARISTVTVIVGTAARPSRFTRLRGWLSRNRTVVLFALLLVATDRTLGLFADTWDRYSPDDYAARVAGCRGKPRDIVCVGGSPVAEGIDPDLLAGIHVGGKPAESVYAMGLSGGTTSDVYHAVLHGCPTPPRVLVYGITASDLNDSRHEPHGPYSLMTWGDAVRWVQLRPESAGWLTRHFAQARLGQASALFRYRHGIRMWLAAEADRAMPGCCPESAREADELREYADALRSGNGYAPSRGFRTMSYAAVKAAGLRPQGFPYLAKYRTGSHLKYLHKLIDWCGAHGTRLILVDMPTTADLETMYPAEFAEYRRRLAEVEAARGIMVIRATRDRTGLTDGHFADLIHMNCDGAKAFGAWLRAELEHSPWS